MNRTTNFGSLVVRRFPLTIFCVLLIWYLCLFRPPRLHFHTFLGFDKVVHITMYLGTCLVFWAEYFRSKIRFTRITLLLLAVIAPILMSGLIELAQEYLTTYRSGDWLDFAANSFGVLLALGIALAGRCLISRRKTSDK